MIAGTNSQNSWKSELLSWVNHKSTRPASPVEFAEKASRGRYRAARHHRLINKYLLKVVNGEIDRLMLCMPPQHGKSQTVSEYFPAWYLGKFPDNNVILTSYESDFAASWGRKVRDLVEEYGTSLLINSIKTRKDSRAANRWGIVGHTGGMYTAGAGGAITGKGAELIIIDDPHKNDQEASSITIQERIWDWYQSTVLTRLHPGGAIILIQTRWHTGDLAGRILKNEGNDWVVLNLPAIAEERDILGRSPGEALWPEERPLSFLQKIKEKLTTYFWSSLYQQHPYDEEGGMFKPELIEIIDEIPTGCQWFRFWDMAITEDAGDYSSGTLMGYKGGLFYIADIISVQKNADDGNDLMEKTCHEDGHAVKIRWEEEKGSNGARLSASFKKSIFKGYDAAGIPVSGSKIVRAKPLSDAIKAGKVKMLRSLSWNLKLKEQMKFFPYGPHDDMIDSTSGAFNELNKGIAEPAVMRRGGIKSKYLENDSSPGRWNRRY